MISYPQNWERQSAMSVPFYRNPAADMLYQEEYLKPEWFDGGYAFHFCSVSLGDFPMKEAHRKAIAYAKEAGMLVSYDPNQMEKAVDTTGAGDGFIGAFLFGLWREGITKQNLEHVSEETLVHCLTLANRFCSISVTKKGAIRSYPSLEEVEQESK